MNAVCGVACEYAIQIYPAVVGITTILLIVILRFNKRFRDFVLDDDLKEAKP